MTRWSVLPAYLVRLAGFSFERLAALRCSRAAQAAVALGDATEARAVAGRALDEALAGERYAEHPELDEPAARKAFAQRLRRARAFARELTAAELPPEVLREVVQRLPRVAAIAGELEQAHARWREAAAAYERVFSDELEQARGALRRLYQDERMQEAVFLQSPEAFDGIRHLLQGQGPRNKPARRRERLAAMYAQRFCAKNDSNSICGPFGVGYLSDAGSPTESRIELVVEDARRETYFSHWAAERLLEAAVQRAGDAAGITWRLQPAVRVDGGAVSWCTMEPTATTFRRRYARSEMAGAGARLVEALAHPRTRAELAALAEELALDAGELSAFVDELIGAGLVVRGPLVPPGLFHPLRAVAGEVAHWAPSDAQAWALSEVAAMEELRASFARAPLADRIPIFQQLAARFAEATGGAAQRGEGQHYADRSVLHEDCFVEVRSELGAARASLEDALPALVSVLELPLELSRERVREWYRARFGEGVRAPVLVVHRAFDDDRVLDTPAATPRAAALRDAIARVQDAIARAAAAAGTGPARLSAGELRRALDGVPAPERAGYVSADVMLRRRPSGGVDLVLAEIHGFVWIPTCALDVMPPDHRERVLEHMRAGVRTMARDKRTVECVFPHTQATDRRLPLANADLQMIVPSARPDAIDLGALDVRLTGDDFELLHGDEEIVPLIAYARYPFLLYTSRLAPLYDEFSDRFFPDSLLPSALREGDAPRLTVDELVVRRRVWRRPAAAVRAALAADSEAELFRRAQGLRRELGCDARVFASIPGEPKPVLIDFENVFLLEAFAHLVERAPDDASVKISEMLPGPDELVARGPDGARTSELRVGLYRVEARPAPSSAEAVHP